MRKMLGALVLAVLATQSSARGAAILDLALIPDGVGGFAIQTTGYESLAAYQIEVLISGVGLDRTKVLAAQPVPITGYVFADNDPGFPSFETALYDSSNDASLGAGEVRVVFSDFYTGLDPLGSVTWVDSSSPSWIGTVAINLPGAGVSARFLTDALLLSDPLGAPIPGFDELVDNLNAVPEPGTLSLVLTGGLAAAVGLSASRRRRRGTRSSV